MLRKLFAVSRTDIIGILAMACALITLVTIVVVAIVNFSKLH